MNAYEQRGSGQRPQTADELMEFSIDMEPTYRHEAETRKLQAEIWRMEHPEPTRKWRRRSEPHDWFPAANRARTVALGILLALVAGVLAVLILGH